MKKISILIFCFFIQCLLSAQNNAILQLDTGGHKARIWDILVTSDKRFLISASDDKTIRIWDVDLGKEVRKIIGQIGNGSRGMISAIALSSDDQYLAVGGYFGDNEIRIYNFPTGEIVQTLKGHSNLVLDVDFNHDGNLLVSGAMDRKVIVWSKENGSFKLYKEFSHHSDDVYGVDIFKENTEYRIVSIGYDQRLNLHSLNSGLIKSIDNSYKLSHVAVSGRYIAVCGKANKISLFDRDLNLIKNIYTKTRPTGLSFSESGRYLVSGHVGFPPNNNIYDLRTGFNKITTFNKQHALTQAVAFIDENTAVTGGGENYEIYFWNINTARVERVIEGKGRKVWSVGISDEKIGFGFTPMTYTNEKTELERYFDLNEFVIKHIQEGDKFNCIPVGYNGLNHSFKLQHIRGGKYGFSDAVLEIRKDGEVLKRIVRDATNGYQHRTYGFTDKGLIISGGNDGYLNAYNLAGEIIGVFIGHTGTVWSIAVDDQLLVSGSSDQTIKLWNLESLRQTQSDVKKIYPLLNIFISKDDEWVVWSEKGYYASSIGGDQFVGYHINRGFDRAADYFSSDRFFRSYYQPSLMKNIVKLKSEEKALAYTKKNMRLSEVTVEDILPPKIELNTPEEIITYNKQVSVDFDVIAQSDFNITDIKIFLNGREIKDRGMKVLVDDNSSFENIRKTIKVPYGTSVLKIVAGNRFAASNPVYIHIKSKNGESVYKPNLYVLSIGISEYKNMRYKLDYAASDAQSIVEIFKTQTKLYQSISHEIRTNTEAGRADILNSIDWLINEATQKDVVIMFIAGHGINDGLNNYYFLSYDADIQNLRSSAVKWTEFKDVITNLPSKVILFVDACHSGNILGSKKRGEADITTAIKDLIAAGTGQVIMTATTDNSAAYEDPSWEHGAFTKALLDGLKYMRADFDKNEIVTIKELDFYITKRVKELTKGHQKPTTIVPESIPDFPIVTK
ncbi:MAG: caspase family protein [bacterium]